MTDGNRSARYADRATQRRIIAALFVAGLEFAFVVGLALAVLRADLPVWLYLALMAPGLTWGLLIYLVPYARAEAEANRLDHRARQQVAYEAALERERERRRA